MTNEEMAVAIQQGRKELIAPLWEQMQRFFGMMAGQCYAKFYERAQRYGVTGDDLQQAAFLALLDMVKAYDPATGYKLTTYAHYACRNQFAALLGYRARITSNDPLNDCKSLDEPISADSDSTRGEFVPDPAECFEDTIQDLWRQELHAAEEQALSTLDPRRANVIRDIYFSNTTQRELSEKYGVALARVGQLKADALRKLRQGKCLKLLRPFCNDAYMSLGLRGVGFTAFSHGGSATERAVESIDEWLKREVENVRRREAERLEAMTAKYAGVSRRTVYNYLRDPNFKQRYEQEKSQLVTATTQQIQRSLSPAITALRGIAEDENVPPGARVQAARALLEYGIRLTEIENIYKRLDNLEVSAGITVSWQGGEGSA